MSKLKSLIQTTSVMMYPLRDYLLRSLGVMRSGHITAVIFTPQNLFHTFQTGTIWIRVYQEMNGSDVLLWSKDLYVQMECATGSGVGDINT